MKKTIFTVLTLGFLGSVAAQDLPQPSPKAKISQVVGLTEVSVEYSSPAVNGRAVWGGLVPYNVIWRTGANMATKVTFSQNVKVGGKDVAAGSYALFSIPGESEWTLILNKNWNQGGTGAYKEEEDVVRVKVKPTQSNFRERLTFIISDFNNDKGNITLEWEKLSVSLPFEVATTDQALKSIEKTLGNTWRQYASSARHLLENNGNLDDALKYIDQSIALKETWFNVWIKAQIVAKKGDKKEALKLAKRAKELGDKEGDGFFFRADVEKAINDWK